MRNGRALVLAGLLAGPSSLAFPAAAQDPPAPAGEAESQDSFATRVAAIIAEHGQAQQDFSAKIKGIEDEAVLERIYAESYPQVGPYVARVQAALAGHEAEPGAAAGLAWVVQEGRDDAARRSAMDLLLAHHVTAPEMTRVVKLLAWGGQPHELEFLERVARDAPTRELKGHALFALARRQAEGAGGDSPAAREQSKRAEELLTQVGREYGDIADGQGTLKASADAYLFELQHLAIGMTAPEIEGTDVDGATFRLSEYRGKVVVLDFWGFW